MSPKDYEMVAKAVRYTQPQGSFVSVANKNIDAVAKELAIMFAKSDPDFDYDQFLLDCGVNTYRKG